MSRQPQCGNSNRSLRPTRFGDHSQKLYIISSSLPQNLSVHKICPQLSIYPSNTHIHIHISDSCICHWRTSGSCPRFILASDCVRAPLPTSWFLPHAGLHLATAHSRSQELERGTRYRLVSPPHHLCPHSGDS